MDDCCCCSKCGIITPVKYSETAEEELTSKREAICVEELAQRDCVSRTPGRLMSERARVAPIEAILMAVARPIPEAAPVMRQVLPWNLVEDMAFFFLVLLFFFLLLLGMMMLMLMMMMMMDG